MTKKLFISFFLLSTLFVFGQITSINGNLEKDPFFEQKQEGKDEPEDANDHTINANQYAWLPYRKIIGRKEK